MSAAPLPTIWEVPDALWELFAYVLDRYDPPKRMGRKRIDARKALNGMIYRMRTGCQWNQLPQRFGDDASVHRTQQRWEQAGVFDLFWARIQNRCGDLDGVDWHWQAADGCLSKAPGSPKRGRKTNASATTPRIVVSKASRKACWSKPTEGR